MTNTHLVCRKSPRFIRADDICTTKRFDAGKASNDCIFLSHFLGPQSETGGDDGCESFRNGSHGERHGDLEIVNRASEKAVVTGVGKVAVIDNPHKDANDRDDLREHVPKVIQFLFERRLLGNLFRYGVVNVSDGSPGPDIDDDCCGPSVDDGGPLDACL